LPTPVPAGAIRHTGGCLQPVLLRGRADYIDGGTGELIHRYTTVHEPGGVLPIACKTRRAARCPPCAEVYRADTYQLIRAGLTGGKGIPATVAEHPCVFVTLTAPSFGPVDARREKDGRVLACRPRRKDKTCPHGIRPSCAEKHARDDHRLGRTVLTCTTPPIRTSLPVPATEPGNSDTPVARKHPSCTRAPLTCACGPDQGLPIAHAGSIALTMTIVLGGARLGRLCGS
jgi:replication initiator protein RepSA